MDERRLGVTDLVVSRLGLGTVELGMAYGIGLPPPPDDRECIALLRQAQELGITFIDTAAAYGRSEELVGRAFEGTADRPVIATKANTRLAGAAQPLRGAALRDQLHTSVATSLRQLRLDSLDLLQFHNLEPEQMDDDLLDCMDELGRQGMVRHWGASTYGEQTPRAVLAHGRGLSTLQLAFSLLDRRLEHDLLPQCAASGTGVIIRSAFLKGVLTPRYADLPGHLEPLRQVAAQADRLAGEAGMPLTEMAMRYAAHCPFAHVVLCGTGSADELKANVRAVQAGPLPADLQTAIRQLHVADEELLNPSTWGF